MVDLQGSIQSLVILLIFWHTCTDNAFSGDYPKSLEEVLAHVESFETPSEVQLKGDFYDEESQFFQRVASNGDLKLTIFEVTESNGKFRSDACVRSHNYLFTATRLAPDKPWLLTKFISSINEEAEQLIEKEWSTHGNSLNMRDKVRGVRLRTLLSQPDLVEATLEPPDDDGLVKISINVPNPEAKLRDPYAKFPLWVRRGEVKLDPNQQYCVASQFFVHSRSDSSGTRRVLEWGEKDGHKYPLKTLDSDSRYGDMTLSEVVFIRFDEVPEREFTLEAFGIPNPQANAPSNSIWSPAVIVAIVGLCLVGLGAGLRYVKRK